MPSTSRYSSTSTCAGSRPSGVSVQARLRRSRPAPASKESSTGAPATRARITITSRPSRVLRPTTRLSENTSPGWATQWKSLARTAATTSEAVIARIDKGEGSLGKFTKDDALYVNANEAVMSLNKAAAEMQKLLADVRREPKRYFKVSVF